LQVDLHSPTGNHLPHHPTGDIIPVTSSCHASIGHIIHTIAASQQQIQQQRISSYNFKTDLFHQTSRLTELVELHTSAIPTSCAAPRINRCERINRRTDVFA